MLVAMFFRILVATCTHHILCFSHRKQHQSMGMELLNKRIKLLNKEYSSTIQTDITDVMKNNEIAGTLVSVKIPIKLSEPLQN